MLHHFCKPLSRILSLFLWAVGLMMGFTYGLIPAPVAAQDNATSFPDAVCLNTFEAFSYADPEESRPGPFAYSTPAWTLHTSVPLDLIPNLPVLEESQRQIFARVVASRRYNDQHELWVTGAVTAPNFRQSFLAIYQPESNAWNFILEPENDPNLFRQSYFVTPDGTVWASNQWLDNALPAMTSVPVLSRFNDSTRQFERVETAPQVQVMDRSLDSRVNLRSEIVLDEQGIFWIFNVDTSLYRFDPASGVSERHFDLTMAAPQGVEDAVLAPDGTIYFSKYVYFGYFDLSDDVIFQYHPVTNEAISVGLPREGWPNYTGLYVDSRNWLWLGTVGYRDDVGEWHLLHTAVEEQFDDPLRQLGAVPITTETSDGRLWATQFDRGTGWLNPVTGTGCYIVRNSRLVYEDIEGYVWVGYGTQGELYRYDATP
jgi:streptogramin lyase